MAIQLTRKESNLIESIIKNYGQVSFEYDAVMEIIQEKYGIDLKLKIALTNEPAKINKKGPIKSRPSIDGHSVQRLI